MQSEDIFREIAKKAKEFPKNLLTKKANYIIMVTQYEKKEGINLPFLHSHNILLMYNLYILIHSRT